VPDDDYETPDPDDTEFPDESRPPGEGRYPRDEQRPGESWEDYVARLVGQQGRPSDDAHEGDLGEDRIAEDRYRRMLEEAIAQAGRTSEPPEQSPEVSKERGDQIASGNDPEGWNRILDAIDADAKAEARSGDDAAAHWCAVCADHKVCQVCSGRGHWLNMPTRECLHCAGLGTCPITR
jgi:hypothetical protein